MHNLVIITLHNQGVVAPLHNPAIAWDETKEAQPSDSSSRVQSTLAGGALLKCPWAVGSGNPMHGAYERVRPKSNNTEISAFEEISFGLLPTPWSFQYSSRLSYSPS